MMKNVLYSLLLLFQNCVMSGNFPMISNPSDFSVFFYVPEVYDLNEVNTTNKS